MLHEQSQDWSRWLTLDRPERLNSFTGADYADLRAAIETATADASTRAIVLTGTGRAFSVGAVSSKKDGTATSDDRAEAGVEFTALLEALGRCDKPVVAAVNGLAVGIGCTILLHCDLVLVAESARLRLPFTALGLGPAAGSSVLRPARARWGDVAWALLSSDWIDASTAVDMGLAWRVVPDDALVAETKSAVGAITDHDPASVAATKRLLAAGHAALVRDAMAREHAELATLLGREAPPGR